MSQITPIAAAIGQVTIRRSRTVNLGNYESETVDISVTVPTTGDYQATYNEALLFVEENLQVEVAKLGGKSINKVATKRIEKETAVQEAEVAEETVQEQVKEPVADKPKVKQQDVRAALKQVKDELGNDIYKGVLSKFGVKSFGAISEDDYFDVIEHCKGLMVEESFDGTVTNGLGDDLGDDLGDGLGDDLDVETVAITLDEFKQALKQYNADNGAGSHKAILSDAGYKSVGEVPEGKYAELMAKLI